MVLVLDATTDGERAGRFCPSAWWCAVAPFLSHGKCWVDTRKAVGAPIGRGWACHLEGRIPAEWQVLVMADRGLYARWLFQAIIDSVWHPFLRINLGVKARAVGE